ncbi:MAG: hypothetical protein WCP77_19095 [Roseococcus sp.]
MLNCVIVDVSSKNISAVTPADLIVDLVKFSTRSSIVQKRSLERGAIAISPMEFSIGIRATPAAQLGRAVSSWYGAGGGGAAGRGRCCALDAPASERASMAAAAKPDLMVHSRDDAV